MLSYIFNSASNSGKPRVASPFCDEGCRSLCFRLRSRRIGAFELWCWRKLLRVPWTTRKANQSILKEISPEYSLEGLILKLKSKTMATWWEELTHWKRPWCWERLKAREEGDNRGWDGWIIDSMDMNVSKLQELVMHREAWRAVVHGVTKNWTWLSDWTELTTLISSYSHEKYYLAGIKTVN